MRIGSLFLAIVGLACGDPRVASPSAPPPNDAGAAIDVAPLAPDAAPPLEVAPAPPPSASSAAKPGPPLEPADAEARGAGPKIRPAPPEAGFWPTRLCTTGPGTLVLERDGCDPPLVCTVHTHGSTLDLVIPRERRACKDCCVRIAVPCSVPVAPDRTLALTVNGKPAVDRLAITGGTYVGVPRCPGSTPRP